MNILQNLTNNNREYDSVFQMQKRLFSRKGKKKYIYIIWIPEKIHSVKLSAPKQ